MYTALDGGTPSAATDLVFDSSGNLVTTVVNQSFALTNGAVTPLAFTLDVSDATQYGDESGLNDMIQDGYTSGRLAGVAVSADGTIQGVYSNGRTRDMGRLVLSTFQNPNGLQNMGGNLWRETADSGQPITGVPGQGNFGVIQSATVEDSNVDLTSELVDMIVQQRAYQANAQTIKTQDQILQTLVNLR
jgi:flagellar hook protein FlgE